MTGEFQTLTLRRDARGITRISLNDPAKRNALSRAMRLELIAALDLAAADPDCKALVLAAEGPVFCAGGDISAMGQGVEASLAGLDLLHRIARQLALFPRPVVAAVAGGAYGAGFSLALLADHLVISEGAKFAASFAKVGLAPDTGFLWSASRRIATQQALQLLASARVLGADEALAMGLADEIVPDAVERAHELAVQLSAVAPLPLAETKAWLAETSGLEAHLHREYQAQARMYQSRDHSEAVAAFREKRAPYFEGR